MNNKIFTKIPQFWSKEADLEFKLHIVYTELRKILAMYESTNCYNDIYEEEEVNYLELKLAKIHVMVNVLFENTEWEEKLHNIIGEVEYFVAQCEMPGVVLRWKQINPKLIFFDCAFELKETLSEEEYLKYQRGLTACRLSLYPDDELVEQRKVYFENAKNNALMENATYSVEKLFEEELLRTLDMVFEQDFCSLE